MKKKKKKIILVTSFIVSIVLVLTVFFVWMFSGDDSVEEDSYSKNIRILNENNVSLVIYGDEIKFRDGVKYKNVSEINESSFNGNEFLVLNDLSSNALLDDEDYTEIKELVSNGVTFMYYGMSKFDAFQEKGFFNYSIDQKYLAFTMSAYSSKATSFLLWDKELEESFKEDDEVLGEDIVFSIVYDELKK